MFVLFRKFINLYLSFHFSYRYANKI